MIPLSFHRRQFIQLSSLSLVTAAMSQADEGQATSDWIDAHVHVWTPDTQSYPLAEGFTQAGMKPSSFTPEELMVHTRPSGVKRIVLIQMSYYRFDNSYMLDTMRRFPGVFSGIGIVDHQADDLEGRVDRLAEQGVRGFRISGSGGQPHSWKTNPGMTRLWEIAAARNLAICPLINPAELASVRELCQRFSETKVVIDHFARIGISGTIDDSDLNNLCDLAKFPNVYVKTSAFYALGLKSPPYHDLKPMLQRLLDVFGPKRLMWASDSPFQVQSPHTYEASIGLIRDADSDFLSSTEKQWLLRDTAASVFFS